MPKREQFRVNIVVTPEQLALLRELANLDPETRSPASFVRQLVDQVTPLLRVMVPAMRTASQELDTSREALKVDLAAFLGELAQLDLLPVAAAPGGANRPQRSEDGCTAKSRARKAPK